MSEVKYSILIPVYNVGSFLSRCVESVEKQGISTEKYEVIITDDGSTDGSSELCDQLAEQYNNIRVIHQQNKGLLQARLTGVRNATGTYLLFVDSDDYVSEKLLITVDKYVDELKPDILMYGINRIKNGKTIVSPLSEKKCVSLTNEELLRQFAESDRLNSMVRKVIRKQVYQDHLDSLACISACVSEDRIQTALLLKYVNSAVLINDCLYFYEIHEESIIHNTAADKVDEFASNHMLALDLYKEALSERPFSLTEQNELISCFKRLALNGIMEHIFKLNVSDKMSRQERVDAVSNIDMRQLMVFSEGGKGSPLKWYNELRYRMLVSKKYKSLIALDHMLKLVQTI